MQRKAALIALLALAASACAGASSGSGTSAPVAAASGSSDPVIEAAEAYAAYRADVAALRQAELGSMRDLEAALERAARHNRVSLQRGWIAYGALHASQSRTFRDGVVRAARRLGRETVLTALERGGADPVDARGERDALGLIYASGASDVAAAETAALNLEGQASAASSWPNPSPSARAARLRRLGAASFAGRPELRPFTLDTPLRGRPMPVAPAREAIARRMTALAAMRILEAEPARMQRVLDDAQTQTCLRMANLQFYQCVSVTHTPDEAAYCLSRHALREVSGCMSFAPAT
ncbi:MAG: hypothetical protein JNJ73_09115 [Hyphomonadaceae bacterium]|nr:hypothetical protein [Hyphomonadaceae bacterium]